MKKEELLEEIQKVVDLGQESIEHEIDMTEFPTIIKGVSFSKFEPLAKIVINRYLCTHVLYGDMIKIICRDDINKPDNLRKLISYFKAITQDNEFLNDFEERITNKKMNNKIFLVHGHDIDRRDEVEQLLRRIGLLPIILMNEPNGGLTLIEKIEKFTDVSYAIVLYTACDQGKEKDSKKRYRPRARQNVVFEHGYLLNKLGRSRVAALVEENVETPGDLSGMVYISFKETDWKTKIMRELKEAEFDFDATRA